MLWATAVIRIRSNDRSSCTILSMFTVDRQVQVCGWELKVYVNVV